jgi:hypothetical protein
MPELSGAAAGPIVPVPRPQGVDDPRVNLRIVPAGWDGRWVWPYEKVASLVAILRWLVTRQVDLIVLAGPPMLYNFEVSRQPVLARWRTTQARARGVAESVRHQLVTDASGLGLAWDRLAG